MGIVECIGKLVRSFASLGLLLATLALIQEFEKSSELLQLLTPRLLEFLNS
jgi:hypothetical protein